MLTTRRLFAMEIAKRMGVSILRKLIVAALVLVVIGLAGFWILTMPRTVSASALGPHTPDLANGKTLLAVGDCTSCHAMPKQKDRTKLGGGRALKTPFGTFYPPNISSDAKDGIGGWSEAQSSPPCMTASAPAASISTRRFPTLPMPTCRSLTCATCSPI